MSETTTLARSYARAAFKFAESQDQLESWSNMLNCMLVIREQEQVMHLLKNPKYGAGELASVFIDLGGDKLSEAGGNFVKLLAENHRLIVLSDIARLYEKFRAEAEKRIDVDVVSVIPLSDVYKQKLINALKSKLSRNVKLHCAIDPSLLGGILVQAGDMVIDNSVRGQLTRLQETIVG